MNNNIHPTAIIEGNINIANNVIIGPYSIIKGNVSIDEGTVLKGHVVIDGDVHIGKNNQIFYFASIGSPPQDLKFKNEESKVIIGDNNIIREYVTINGGSDKGNDIIKVKNRTIIGNNCWLYTESHVAHDVVIGNNVTITNNVALGGHVAIDDYVIIGGNSAIHQDVHVGRNAMIGGMCAIGANVPPFSLIKHDGNNISGINIIGLKRAGFDKIDIINISKIFKSIANNNLTMERKIQIIQNDLKNQNLSQELINFIQNMNDRGLCRFEL